MHYKCIRITKVFTLLLFASLLAPLAQAQLNNFNGPLGGATNAKLTLQMIQQRADMWLGQAMQRC